MYPQTYAKESPDKPAIVMARSGETVSYGQLDRASNKGAHLFRKLGLQTGDCMAIYMENRADFMQVAWAAYRAGLYIALIASHLKTDEVRYILENSGSKVLVTSQKLAETARAASGGAKCTQHVFSVDEGVDGMGAWWPALEPLPATPIDDESRGQEMLYTSGTTGRPKGVKVPLAKEGFEKRPQDMEIYIKVWGFNQDTVYLSPGPLYHAAPFRTTLMVLFAGGTNVVMEKFDAEEFLRLVERYKVTNSQVVPTMFVRMLALDEETRNKYDLSSLKQIIHAAAPCPVEVKERMLDWLGMIIYEGYGGSEGVGATTISPQEWLEHKGSVGRAVFGKIHILDDDMNELGPGEVGNIYFETQRPFEYHNDPEKTKQAHSPQGYVSCGDIGYLDEEGYLYLTDRKDHMIISGGVNIYPVEIENVLITHPDVADVAVFGIPDVDFGEIVMAVVELHPDVQGSDALAEDLIGFCRARLSKIKAPKRIEFIDHLPRTEMGKLKKHELKALYV